MKEKESSLSVVGGRGFDALVEDMTAYTTRMVSEYRLSQKMAARLVDETWRRVEKGQVFRAHSPCYIRDHLEEQIVLYVAAGVHTALGLSEEGFSAAFEPLIKKTVDFFAPPAGHPIMDGEFTCFLVPPLEWGCSLRFLIGKLRPAFSAEFREVLGGVTCRGDVVRGGNAAPETPYVLVGVKGGRGLKALTRADADKESEKFGFSYFSAYQLALLLLIRPKFLLSGERAIALGEQFSEKLYLGSSELYLGFSSVENGFLPSFTRAPAPSSLAGVGKPYYTRMIT